MKMLPLIGLKVISALDTPGVITEIYIDPAYSIYDTEKNPIVHIEWSNGKTSTQPLSFLNKIKIE